MSRHLQESHMEDVDPPGAILCANRPSAEEQENVRREPLHQKGAKRNLRKREKEPINLKDDELTISDEPMQPKLPAKQHCLLRRCPSCKE